MQLINLHDSFNESLNTAYGSKKNFENELIHKALELRNRGILYFKINEHFNFIVNNKSNVASEYILLSCNLENCDIFNFIEDIDYNKLSNAYRETKKLIESKEVIRL